MLKWSRPLLIHFASRSHTAASGRVPDIDTSVQGMLRIGSVFLKKGGVACCGCCCAYALCRLGFVEERTHCGEDSTQAQARFPLEQSHSSVCMAPQQAADTPPAPPNL